MAWSARCGKGEIRVRWLKFDEDERYFRAGFEAALHAKNRNKSYEEFRPQLLTDLYSVTQEREAFRRGYNRGRAYNEVVRQRQS